MSLVHVAKLITCWIFSLYLAHSKNKPKKKLLLTALVLMFYWVKQERQQDLSCSLLKVGDFFKRKKYKETKRWALKIGPDSGQEKLQNKTTATLPARSALITRKSNVPGVPRTETMAQRDKHRDKHRDRQRNRNM